MFSLDVFNAGSDNRASSKDDRCLRGDTFDRQRFGADRDANDRSATFSPPNKNEFATTSYRGDDMGDFFEGSGGTEDNTFSIPDIGKNLYYGGSNTSDITIQEKQQQQQLFSYSPPQQQQQDQQQQHQQIPLPITSQNNLGQSNVTHIFSDKQRHDLRDEDCLLEQHHSIDVLMAKELNQLSFRQRNDISEEIHGVNSLYNVDETPELISRALTELQFEIDHNVPLFRKMAYERSEQIYKKNIQIQEQQQPSSASSSSVPNSTSNNNPQTSNGYIKDPNFVLMFLRRDRFVVRKTALRLVGFVELVYELWGEIGLSEKVWMSQSAFSPFELNYLRSGSLQVLAGRDRAGRRICANFANDGELSVNSRVSIVLYRFMKYLTAT